jgi:hypothetical protein
MTNAPKSSPLLKAAPLWARSSVKGGQYLSGRLGSMKVLILENRDRQGADDPSHILYFTEAAPRPAGQERDRGQQATDHQAPLWRNDPPRSRPPAGDRLDDGPEWER